eukprot:4975967-Prymnesium_polylepis.1
MCVQVREAGSRYDIARVAGPRGRVHCAIQQPANGFDVVRRQQRLVWPFHSKLPNQQHRLPEPLVAPILRLRAASTRSCSGVGPHAATAASAASSAAHSSSS